MFVLVSEEAVFLFLDQIKDCATVFCFFRAGVFGISYWRMFGLCQSAKMYGRKQMAHIRRTLVIKDVLQKKQLAFICRALVTKDGRQKNLAYISKKELDRIQIAYQRAPSFRLCQRQFLVLCCRRSLR